MFYEHQIILGCVCVTESGKSFFFSTNMKEFFYFYIKFSTKKWMYITVHWRAETHINFKWKRKKSFYVFGLFGFEFVKIKYNPCLSHVKKSDVPVEICFLGRNVIVQRVCFNHSSNFLELKSELKALSND